MLTDRYTSGDTEPKTGDTGVGPASDGKRLTAVIRGRSVQAPQQEHVIVIGRNRAERAFLVASSVQVVQGPTLAMYAVRSPRIRVVSRSWSDPHLLERE